MALMRFADRIIPSPSTELKKDDKMKKVTVLVKSSLKELKTNALEKVDLFVREIKNMEYTLVQSTPTGDVYKVVFTLK